MITIKYETNFDFEFDTYNKSVLKTKEQGSFHFNVLSKKRKDGLMDYIDAFDHTQQIAVSPDGDQYWYKYDMDKKPLGFIYTNVSTDDYRAFKELKNLNITNLIRKLAKGIPKEYLITYPKYDCFLQHIALKSPVLEEFINQLSVMKPETIPFLIYRHLESKLSPLDIAIKDNNINCVNMLISILLKY